MKIAGTITRTSKSIQSILATLDLPKRSPQQVFISPKQQLMQQNATPVQQDPQKAVIYPLRNLYYIMMIKFNYK